MGVRLRELVGSICIFLSPQVHRATDCPLFIYLESGPCVAVVPVPGAHAGLALHEVGDHLELLEKERSE